MAGRRILRRRVPDGGARRESVQQGRGESFHHPRNAPPALAGCAPPARIDAIMTSRPYAEVIGDPIEQSLSPTIHGFWLEALGIEAEYGRRQVTRADLPAYIVERRSDPNWRG